MPSRMRRLGGPPLPPEIAPGDETPPELAGREPSPLIPFEEGDGPTPIPDPASRPTRGPAITDSLGAEGAADAVESNLSRKSIMTKHRIYTTSVASVYPHYVTKAEKKGRTKEEVDEIIRWLTGYRQDELESHLERRTDFETFFASAPHLNPSRGLIRGVVCGIRVEDIDEPTMQEIRYLDKLIDELAKGKAMEKILRKQTEA